MKVVDRVLDVTSTLEGEKIGMTIDPNALAHIMSVLTDLYSDPEMAVIREYSTNAFDAHIEAGVERPIEVTTPTNLSPFFRVRDFGFGLDAEDIRTIYSQYGTSTKRESDDVVGMLGLGCKSALTYTDQFTLSGIKDGICTLVSISRDEDGSGSMTIVDTFETDDPSGVEIVVPVKGFNQLETKSKDFFRFWTEGTVLVNGLAPTRVDGMWLTGDLLLTREVGQSYVVMGNVAYPVDIRIGNAYNRPNLVAFVNIGDVNFVPSREALQMTNRTKATIQTVTDRATKELLASYLRTVESAVSKPDALRKLSEIQGLGFNGTAQYKGVDVPETFSAPVNTRFVHVESQKPRYGKGWSADRTMGSMSDAIWLTGYELDTFTPYKRQKLNQWQDEFVASGNTRPRYYLLCKEVPADAKPWIEPSKILSYAPIDAQKITRDTVARADGRPTGSYDGYVAGVYCRGIEAKNIDTTLPVFWYRKNTYSIKAPLNIIKQKFPDATIIELANNRINKFKRDFTMAGEVVETVKTMATNWKSSLTANENLFIQIHNSGSKDYLNKLDPSLIKDPVVKKAIRVSKLDKPSILKDYVLYSNWISFASWENPLQDYPLFSGSACYGEAGREHTYIYLNAVHAATQEA